MVIGPEEPTHHNRDGTGDVLDIAILKDVPLPVQLTAMSDLDSDHNPVLLTLGTGPAEQDARLAKTTCWAAFTDHLDESMPRIPIIHSPADLEKAVESVTNAIQLSLQASTTTKEQSSHRDPIPEEIKQLIRDRNKARRRYQRYWDAADRIIYHDLKRAVRNALTNRRNEAWKSKIDSLENDSRAFWRMTRALRSKNSPIPPIHGENGIALTDENKAEAFAEALEKRCSLNLQDADLDFIVATERTVRRALENVAQSNLPHATCL